MTPTAKRGTRLPRLSRDGAAALPALGRKPRPLSLDGRAAAALPLVGRVTVVWLACYGVTHGQIASTQHAILVSLLLTAIWVSCINVSLSLSQRHILAIGPYPACLIGTLTGLFAVSTLDRWTHVSGIGARHVILAGLVFLLAVAWETFSLRTLAAHRRLLIVGATDGAVELLGELARTPDAPFEVIGVVDDTYEQATLSGVPVKGQTKDLATIVDELRPDLVVLCIDRNRPEVFRQLLEVAAHGFAVMGLPELFEHAFGRVPVRHLSAAWFMSVLHLYQRPYTRVAKRTLDVIVALIGGVLVAPLVPFLIVLVKLTSPGPAIYRQVRLGEGGRHFTMYKFRTMGNNAEEPGHPVWAMQRDPRVTPVGRFLRLTRLDELPQIWNVLRGDMSIVGPRPERPEFLALLDLAVPFWTRRHLLKPGITGWAQVRHGYAADAASTEQKLSYDLWYLRHRSLTVDLLVCARTVARLIPGNSGAH